MYLSKSSFPEDSLESALEDLPWLWSTCSSNWAEADSQKFHCICLDSYILPLSCMYFWVRSIPCLLLDSPRLWASYPQLLFASSSPPDPCSSHWQYWNCSECCCCWGDWHGCWRRWSVSIWHWCFDLHFDLSNFVHFSNWISNQENHLRNLCWISNRSSWCYLDVGHKILVLLSKWMAAPSLVTLHA